MSRDCFVAPAGKVLVELDFSQLELRVAAMLAQDQGMIDIFREGVDYHQRTAEMVSRIAWGVEPEDVSSENRTQAKAVNFGILYGKTAASLAREWGVARSKAEAVFDAILGRFDRLQAWRKEQIRHARRHGEVWTWWNGHRARRRPLIAIADADDGKRAHAENAAVNTPVQGTASDFCVSSLAACTEWIVDDGIEDLVKLVMTVHDSLMFECDADMVDEVVGTAREIMTGWNSAGVPLVVDAKVGRAWGSLEDYEE